MSIEAKIEAARASLPDLGQDPSRVRSLGGWDWIDDYMWRLPSQLPAVS